MHKHITEGNRSMTSTILTWTLFIKGEPALTEEGVRQIMDNELMQQAVAKGNWLAFC